ncbi:WD repeat-containing protein RUP2-like [Aristolochia californica]|uniref:WD repeat-containing protein RUP2-like n=1 Tax=Aristolochia californica TaxID=171875 RepID=UPI0035E2F687
MDPSTSSERREDDDEEEEQEKALCEWNFHLSTLVATTAVNAAVSDTLGVIEIDPSEQILATAGIARKIRIYSLRSLVGENVINFIDGIRVTTKLDHSNACEYYICTPAKLSSLRWRPDSSGRVMGAGDYDGVVTEYDLERRTAIFERDEHSGRRVWGVDYSKWSPVVGASGSDDGTAQIWDTRGSGSVATICPGGAQPSPVCCVEFDPAGGPMIAVGSADRKAYVYDARKMATPVAVFSGHRKTVTYARFVSGEAMVSASTDGCLKQWRLLDARAVRTHRGHVNARRFVGLSAWRSGGLLACGSETNEVYVYDKRWGQPIWVRHFKHSGGPECEQEFVSSVCWKQAGEEDCTLVAGGSDGVLQIFVGRKKPIPK